MGPESLSGVKQFSFLAGGKKSKANIPWVRGRLAPWCNDFRLYQIPQAQALRHGRPDPASESVKCEDDRQQLSICKVRVCNMRTAACQAPWPLQPLAALRQLSTAHALLVRPRVTHHNVYITLSWINTLYKHSHSDLCRHHVLNHFDGVSTFLV